MPTHKYPVHHQPHQTPSKSHSWVIVTLALIAMLNLSFLGLRALAAQRIRQRYAQAMGLIIDVAIQRPNETSVEHHYPVVEFHTADGQSVIFKAKQGSPEPKYQTGQVVTVLYNKEKPYVAIVDSTEAN